MIVAQIYAQTLFESIKDFKLSSSDANVIENQLNEFVKIVLDNKTLRTALFSPATSRKEKTDLINSFADKMQMNALLRKFLVLLAQKERLNVMDEITHELRERFLDEEGGVVGELVSADPVVEEELREIERVLSKRISKTVSLRTSVDPSLLAGMKVTVKGETYDGTLRWHLQLLRDQLIHGVEMMK